MAKKCKKCEKKYDDTWGVCLLCGDELHHHEEEEPKTPEEENLEDKLAVQSFFFIMFISIVILIILYLIFTRGVEIWNKVFEGMLLGG